MSQTKTPQGNPQTLGKSLQAPTVKVKRCSIDPALPLPYRATDRSAAFDLCVDLMTPYEQQTMDEVIRQRVAEEGEFIYWAVVEEKKVLTVPTGFAFQIPAGWCGLILPRSGLARDHGLVLANTVGVVDADYRGEVMLSLMVEQRRDEGFATAKLEHGERVAQLVLTNVMNPTLEEVEELEETARGSGGFGSTGDKQ